jgi:predicted nucleic acid-binding protein
MVTPFVLDTSVAIAWCFEDESTPASRALIDSMVDQPALVPPLWRWEIANALLTAERRGRIDPASAERFLDLLEQLPILVDTDSSRQAFRATWQLARAHDLTSYDAAYLELAQRLGLPLATRDLALAAAAETAGIRRLAA